MQFATNEAWLGYLSSQLENKEDLFTVLGFKQRLEKVTTASVQKNAKEFLSGKNEIKFELLPEK